MGIVSAFCAVLLLSVGVYLTLKSGFFQFLRWRLIFRVTFKKLFKSRNLAGFKAMSIALGSTIGIGNIIGVAAAVIIGGPGAVFWMLMTGFAGMMIKFAEVYICVDEAKTAKRASGGPMYVFKNRCSGIYKKFGNVFAAVTVLASFFAGNLMQSRSVYRFTEIGFDIDFLPVTLLIVPLLFVILIGKDRMYQNLSAVFVPLMSLFYIVSVLIIIFVNIENVPGAVLSVFQSAFGLKQAAGGFSGAVLSSALRTGVMKGLFTHEAGMGSSPIAHASTKDADPFCQGCWGIIEVFIDTVVVCMLTAVAVLSSPIYLNSNISDPFTLITEIFSSVFGTFGIKALSISSCCFAFASIIGWSFYGLKALEFLSQKPVHKKIYVVIFLLTVPLSVLFDEGIIWILTDIFNSAMLIPNCCLLMCFGGEAVGALAKIKKVLEIKRPRAYNIPQRR